MPPGLVMAWYTSATKNLNHPPIDQMSLLAPAAPRFLEQVYYGTTDKSKAEDVSSNSASHGTADFEKHSLKSSLLGLLIVDQLFFYLRPNTVESSPITTQPTPEAKVDESA